MNDYFKTVIKERIADELERGYEIGTLAELISEALNEAEASFNELQKKQLHQTRLNCVEVITNACIDLINTYEDELPEGLIQEMQSVIITEKELEKSLRLIEDAFKSYTKMSAGLADFAAKLEPVAVDIPLNKKDTDPDAILRKWVNSLT